MHKKTTILMLTIVVVLLLFLSANTNASENTFNDPSRMPNVTRIVTKKPLQDEPKDWPIVKEVRSESVDERTGVKQLHITIVREQPDEDKSMSECDPTKLVSCNPSQNVYMHESHTLSTNNGWITSHASHWQTKYCFPGDPTCIFRKPYQLQIWWTRSDQSWRADNADVGWGCTWCNVCGGGTTGDYMYNDYFTPQWSGNGSHYYTYTSTTWKITNEHDSGGWRAGSWSDAYYGWHYIGKLSTNATG